MIQKIVTFILSLYIPCTLATQLHCELMLPQNLQVDAIEGCNQRVVQLSKQQQALYNSNHLAFNDVLMSSTLFNNNFGGSMIKFPDGTQKTVYRSAIIGGSETCLQNIVKTGKVDTIINLNDRNLGHAHFLNLLEQQEFQKNGGRVYTNTLNFSVLKSNQAAHALYKQIAEIIHLVQTSPGNVLIHCLIGSHETGVIFGVMQKCYNKIPLKEVLVETSCHLTSGTSFTDQAKNKVFEIITNYPCGVLFNGQQIERPDAIHPQ